MVLLKFSSSFYCLIHYTSQIVLFPLSRRVYVDKVSETFSCEDHRKGYLGLCWEKYRHHSSFSSSKEKDQDSSRHKRDTIFLLSVHKRENLFLVPVGRICGAPGKYSTSITVYIDSQS